MNTKIEIFERIMFKILKEVMQPVKLLQIMFNKVSGKR